RAVRYSRERQIWIDKNFYLIHDRYECGLSSLLLSLKWERSLFLLHGQGEVDALVAAQHRGFERSLFWMGKQSFPDELTFRQALRHAIDCHEYVVLLKASPLGCAVCAVIAQAFHMQGERSLIESAF